MFEKTHIGFTILIKFNLRRFVKILNNKKDLVKASSKKSSKTYFTKFC